MPNAKDHKLMHRIALGMHLYNERVNVGWNVYLAPYISMLYYLSLMEIVVAKLFPDLFVSATSLAVFSYLAFIWLSHWLGVRHERVEALRKRMSRQKEEDLHDQLEAIERKIREKGSADLHRRMEALENKMKLEKAIRSGRKGRK